MSLGYASLYSNGLNNNTQIRRSVDMIYQRGANYNIVLTGTSYIESLEMDVDLYVNDSKVGRMSLVPASITQTGSTVYYNFNLRPYDYVSNYIQSQHYTGYTKNDFYTTNLSINYNNPYPNSITANYKYGYRYVVDGVTITEYTLVGEPFNDLVHYTDLPYCRTQTSFNPSEMTNTGPHYDYVGGSFQLDNRFVLQNFDQELGTTINNGITITSDVYRRLSPMSQYILDYPTVPEMSQTGRFLTDAPRIQYVQSEDNYVLYYLNGQTGDRQVIEADFAVLEFFDGNNNKLTGYTINQQLNYVGTAYASPTGYTDTLQPFALPCGPADLTNLYSSPSFNWNTVAYYTVQLFYSYPTNSESRSSVGPIGPVSEQFYFYLYENCQPEDTRVVFLNARGGYDYFTFKSFRQDTKKISSQTFDSRYYSTDLASPDRDYGRSVKTFATDLNQEIVLESDFLSVPTANWLEQLFYSPQVYLMKPDFISPIDVATKYYKDLTPLQVLSTEVETITKKHRKLNKYRITFKTGDTFFVNRGF